AFVMKIFNRIAGPENRLAKSHRAGIFPIFIRLRRERGMGRKTDWNGADFNPGYRRALTRIKRNAQRAGLLRPVEKVNIWIPIMEQLFNLRRARAGKNS